MNGSDFEENLKRVPLRPVPGEWRNEILGRAAAATESRPKVRAWLRWLEEITRPRPVAWGGLAAAWVFIALLQMSSAQSGVPISATLVASGKPVRSSAGQELIREHKIILAALLDTPLALPIEPPQRHETNVGPQSKTESLTAAA